MKIFPEGPQERTGEYDTFKAAQYPRSPSRHLEVAEDEMKKDIQEHGTVEFTLNTLIHAVRKSPPLNTTDDLRLEKPKLKSPSKVTRKPRT